jgi:hypothetical protein
MIHAQAGFIGGSFDLFGEQNNLLCVNTYPDTSLRNFLSLFKYQWVEPLAKEHAKS